MKPKPVAPFPAKSRRRYSLAAAIILSSPGLAQAQAGPAAPDIDPIFAQWNSAKSPGCAIAVDRPGQPVLALGYGMADLEHDIRITPDTVFEAGSVSKQFTAAAVLKLVETGKLKLDTDVRTIIPELPDYGQVITVDQLMNHTSGLRDWGAVVGLAGWPRTTRVFTQNDFLGVVAKQRALNFEPGAESSYTNTGYNLLTEIVLRVSGQSLADFSQDVFFRPLGMNHTRWRDNFREIVPGRAQAYDWTGKAYQQEMPFENTYGNGGLLTTVGDLLIWNRALDSGAVGALVTPKLSERSTLRDGRTLTYGRGLFNYSFQGVPEIAHSGATAGYRAWLGRYPTQKLSIAMLCNASNAPTTLGRQVAAKFLPMFTPPKPVKKVLDGLFVSQATGAPLKLEDYQSTESRVVSKDRIELVGRDGNIAVYLRTPAATPASVKLTEFPARYASDEVGAVYVVSAGTDGLIWRIQDRPDFMQTLKPIYRDAFQGDDAIIRFTRDSRGQITGLTVGVERARKVAFSRIPN